MKHCKSSLHLYHSAYHSIFSTSKPSLLSLCQYSKKSLVLYISSFFLFLDLINSIHPWISFSSWSIYSSSYICFPVQSPSFSKTPFNFLHTVLYSVDINSVPIHFDPISFFTMLSPSANFTSFNKQISCNLYHYLHVSISSFSRRLWNPQMPLLALVFQH